MINCHVNGQLRQMASTRDMVFNVPKLISFISSIMTLLPGDIIFTGTPSGVGPLEKNDRIDVSIEGIGVLSNPVI
jgi:2-keto-4-pentenoate hydratase/2-oxohepta-3-ene-1,7-dioic acid hydratase in catechol pathway